MSTISEPSSAPTRHSKSNGALGKFTERKEGLFKKNQARLPSTQGLLMKSGTMGIVFLDSVKKHRGPP
jgi:hypothetical protein